MEDKTPSQGHMINMIHGHIIGITTYLSITAKNIPSEDSIGLMKRTLTSLPLAGFSEESSDTILRNAISIIERIVAGAKAMNPDIPAL